MTDRPTPTTGRRRLLAALLGSGALVVATQPPAPAAPSDEIDGGAP